MHERLPGTAEAAGQPRKSDMKSILWTPLVHGLMITTFVAIMMIAVEYKHPRVYAQYRDKHEGVSLRANHKHEGADPTAVPAS